MLKDKIVELIRVYPYEQSVHTSMDYALYTADQILNLIQPHAKGKGWSKPVMKDVQAADMTVKREVFVPLTDEDFK